MRVLSQFFRLVGWGLVLISGTHTLGTQVCVRVYVGAN